MHLFTDFNCNFRNTVKNPSIIPDFIRNSVACALQKMCVSFPLYNQKIILIKNNMLILNLLNSGKRTLTVNIFIYLVICSFID